MTVESILSTALNAVEAEIAASPDHFQRSGDQSKETREAFQGATRLRHMIHRMQDPEDILGATAARAQLDAQERRWTGASAAERWWAER